jgi:hypothetical protein
MRREAIEVRLKNLRAEFAAITEERLRIGQQIEDNRRTAEEMEERMGQLKHNMEMEMSSIESDYVQLSRQVARYQASLNASMHQAAQQVS